MITAAQVTRRAAAEGVPARTIERDYVLAHALGAIAEVEDDRLVFKGGTALRYCFVDNFRYSADLDFSIVGGTADEGREVVSAALARLRAAETFELLELDSSTPPRIRFVGPLGSERRVKLDLADDELVVQSERVPLLRRWDDLEPGVSLRAYTTTEIAGEKLRCVMQRLQCRDFFDLGVLFDSLAVDPGEAADRFRDKAVHRRLDPDRFADLYRDRVDDYALRWNDELAEHLAQVPHFDTIQRSVARHLRRARLL